MDNRTNNVEQNNGPFETQRGSEGEIDLRELFGVIWQAKLTIVIVTAVFAVLSVIFAISQPNIYKSETLLTPAERQGGGGLASLAGQFGGLASLAGVNLGGGSSNKTQLAIEVLKSRQFTSAFIQKHDILPDLMAAESWDIQTNEITYDTKLFDKDNQEWVRKASVPFKPKPSMQEAYEVFDNIVSFSVNKETGIVTLMVEHLSPYIAQRWVKWLVEDINETMKSRDVEEARESAIFLRKQLEQTEVADIREVLYRLIEEQMKTIMFANIRDEYVFKTVDAALVPERKFKPKRALISILGTMLGFGLGLLIVLIRHYKGKQVKNV